MSRRAKHKKRIVSAVSARTGPTLLAAGGQISLEISGIVFSFEGSVISKRMSRNLYQGQKLTLSCIGKPPNTVGLDGCEVLLCDPCAREMCPVYTYVSRGSAPPVSFYTGTVPVCVIRVPVCARVSRVCPGSPRCLFTVFLQNCIHAGLLKWRVRRGARPLCEREE